MNVAPLLIIKMHGARDARVKRMYGPQDFRRLLGIFDGGAEKSGLIGGSLPLVIARGRIPCTGDDELVILDLLLFDHNPVRQCAARGFAEADAPGLSP